MDQKRNMLIYFLGKLVPAFSVLFIMVAGVRYLGKSEFGRYTLLFNSVNIALTFCVGWIQQSMLRFSPGKTAENENQFRQFFKYTLYSATIAAIVIFILDLVYFGEPVNSAIVVAAFTFLFCMFTVQLTSLQCRFKSTEFALTESGFYLVAIASVAFIIFLELTPAMILFFCGWLLAAVVWMAVEGFRNRIMIQDSFRIGVDIPFLKQAFQYGVLITAWLMISGLYNVVDRFVIRHFYNFEEVGVYSVVYDFIYRLTSFATLPILLTLHPLIMKAWNDNQRDASRQHIRKAMALMGLILIGEMIVYLVGGEWFFQKFFNLEREGLTRLMVPLIISSVLWQAALFIHKPLELLFRQKQMIIGIIVSLACNLVLNFIFVPRYGILAAAHVTLASTAIYILYVTVAASRLKKQLA